MIDLFIAASDHFTKITSLIPIEVLFVSGLFLILKKPFLKNWKEDISYNVIGEPSFNSWKSVWFIYFQVLGWCLLIIVCLSLISIIGNPEIVEDLNRMYFLTISLTVMPKANEIAIIMATFLAGCVWILGLLEDV